MRALTLVLVLGAVLALPLTAPAADTLWIFDADFEDVLGDNAGWTSEDRSGTLGITNYWHKDTIRINGFAHLGDSTWWCGTVNPCWRQSRGYGNDWTCSLERRFLEVEVLSDPGDALTLEWDQRIAMETAFDYGYVDVSTDDRKTWTTVYHVTNPGFFGQPGDSKDWDDPTYGHPVIALDEYAGAIVDLRYRFESDGAYSSQDQYDNPPHHSVRDGAWQLDNIEWKVNGTRIWFDDCEAPGDNGWVHDDIPAAGQTGVVYERHEFEDLGAPGDPRSGWMMAAIDTATGTTVDDGFTALISPPIDVGGESALVAQWTVYVDLPSGIGALRVFGSEYPECYTESGGGGFDEYDYYDQWGWVSVTDDWSALAGDPPWWLHVILTQSTDAGPHGAGLVLDRFRVGVPIETGVPDMESAPRLTVHPNPFNPRATVEYTVPSAGRVTLAVYDLAGRLVATLVDDERGPGPHEATWNGTTDGGARAASGVYFVKLTTKTTEATERLVLLK
ncbi:MAG: T9SS type A sorting domain-containing protein [Candidatus Eisenbacteria bacterium]|nr:T9SS type A sorting domain-containing protein [Candidatus Eisenbacteria bacterium]